MVNSYKALGLSFHNTPLQVREKMALDEDEAKLLLIHMSQFTPATDLLVLSTCNRTEIYYNDTEDRKKEILSGLSLIKGIERDLLDTCFHSVLDHDETIRHLFDVAIGLESQVVGDLQIINQVKRAYQWSADKDLAGPLLHRLMHTIFFTNKRVVQETAFRDGAASVSYAAKELIEEVTAEIIGPRVLILGVGEIGQDVCRNLVGSSVKEVYIANRTESRATALATECGFHTIPFAEALDQLSEMDVVVSSVAAEAPIVTEDKVRKFDVLSHKFYIDLSVPRSVDPAIEHIPGILVYNIDNIQSKASEVLSQRVASIPAVRALVDEALAEFHDWSKEMVVSPTIKKLKQALEDIRKEELSRFVKNASEEEARHLDKVTKSMMQKIIKLPVLQLKAACKRGEAETLIDVLNDLFNLEAQQKDHEESGVE